MKPIAPRFSLAAAAAVLSIAAFAAPANAHFIWVVAEPAEGGVKLQLSFGEDPKPAEAYLLDKVAHSKLWVVALDGTRTLAKLAKQAQGDEGAWVAMAAAQPAALEAVCPYGIFSRSGKAFLLNYYARYQQLGDAAVVPAKDLRLAVVPAAEGDAIRLRVLWQDKVVSEGVEIVAAGPDGKPLEANVDGDSFTLPNVGGGRYVIRAKLAQDVQGKHDGETYEGVLNYSTLTLDVTK